MPKPAATTTVRRPTRPSRGEALFLAPGAESARVKRPTYLDLGRRTLFGRPTPRRAGPVEPPPDPREAADFDLGTWRVRPALGRMTRADRIVALDLSTLQIILILAAAPPGGVNRDELAARVFGIGDPAEYEPKLRRALGFLRRTFSEDGAVRVENAPGDCYLLRVGEPVPGRGLRAAAPDVMLERSGGEASPVRRARRRWLGIALAALLVLGLGAGFVTLVGRGARVPLGTVASVTVLAAEPGIKMSPSFAPDGRQLVYSWQRPGSGEAHLYVRGTGGGAPRAITSGPARDLYPSWSPGAAMIAFERLSGDACGVFVIAPDGSGEREIGRCDFGAAGPMAWARDGAALVFAHRSAAILPSQLVSFAFADARLTGVTNPVIGMPGDSRPALARNGRRLVFVRTRSPGVADLNLIDTAAGEVERITRDGVPPEGAVWDAGGRSLLFASTRGGRSALWRTLLDGSEFQRLYSASGELRAPTVSGDGRQVAFEHWQIATRLVRLAAPQSGDDSGAGPVQLTIAAPAAAPAAAIPSAAASAPAAATAPDTAPAPATAAAPAATAGSMTAAQDRHAQLSPDRAQLVFVSNRGSGEQLWIAPSAGGAARPLTRASSDYLATPRWSPDGRKVVFAAAEAGRFDLWAVEVASGKLERLSDDGRSRNPAFSRDGRWLYFASTRGGRIGDWQLWRRGWPDEGKAQQLTTGGGFAAIESRDGDTLYFVRADRGGLWSRGREPGGDETLVVPELAAADWDNWDVGSEAVWFVARGASGPPVLARYAFATQAVSRLRPLPALLPRSGLALDAPAHTLILAEVTEASADLEIAALD